MSPNHGRTCQMENGQLRQFDQTMGKNSKGTEIMVTLVTIKRGAKDLAKNRCRSQGKEGSEMCHDIQGYPLTQMGTII